MITPDPNELIEVDRMIGKPWSNDGIGPDQFHCWGVLVHLYRLFRDTELPHFSAINPRDQKRVSQAIDTETDRGKWLRIPKPKHFCGVALGRSKRFHHVGIFLNWDCGYVLHAAEAEKVLCPTLEAIRNNWSRIEFYELNPNG